MTKHPKSLTLLLFLIITASFYAQIKVKPLPYKSEILSDSSFFYQNSVRKIKLLNRGWKIYWKSNDESKSSTTLPAVFEGNESLVYETNLDFSEYDLHNKTILLGFLGINYSYEISLNNYNIYKRSSGEIPAEVELPIDIIKPASSNKLIIKVDSKLNSENTIPVTQRFLFPKNNAGIIRDIYVRLIPKIHISKLTISKSLDKNLIKAKINLDLSLENLSNTERELAGEGLSVKINIKPKNVSGSEVKFEAIIPQTGNDKYSTKINLEILNPQLWNPEAPNLYLCEVSIFTAGRLVDQYKKEFAIFNFDKNNTEILLNNKRFSFKGTTYFLNESLLENKTVYDKLFEDLSLIKKTGFNSVRFAKQFPHPYALTICQNLGLIALLEMPINSVPEEIFSSNDYKVRTASHTADFLDAYLNYSNSFLFGAGGGYLINSKETENFISTISKLGKSKGINTYASFYGIQKDEIHNLDFYGIELFTRTSDDAEQFLAEINSELSYFISEINYPNYYGSASGYLVKNSSEAHAKYLENVISIVGNKKINGYLINSFFNYTGNYSSLYAGYSRTDSYSLGIIDDNEFTNSLQYKVISSKLNQGGKVTIPIGSISEENKLVFIILALVLSLVMAVIINTKKKFREDCTRALFRPYNFFADIRDQRIISGVQTFILLLVEAGSASLLTTIVLYYMRTNILLEKILLSFGTDKYINTISYLAWHPEQSFIYLFGITIFKILLLTMIIKGASYTIKTRVRTINVFYTVVWAFLPFTILLPVELILYKILTIYSLNSFILVILVLFGLWILQRVIKGIYVIFDVRPLKVYFYSFIVIVLFLGTTALYFHLSSSTFYYITNFIKQYNSTPF